MIIKCKGFPLSQAPGGYLKLPVISSPQRISQNCPLSEAPRGYLKTASYLKSPADISNCPLFQAPADISKLNCPLSQVPSGYLKTSRYLKPPADISKLPVISSPQRISQNCPLSQAPGGYLKLPCQYFIVIVYPEYLETPISPISDKRVETLRYCSAPLTNFTIKPPSSQPPNNV